MIKIQRSSYKVIVVIVSSYKYILKDINLFEYRKFSLSIPGAVIRIVDWKVTNNVILMILNPPWFS